ARVAAVGVLASRARVARVVRIGRSKSARGLVVLDELGLEAQEPANAGEGVLRRLTGRSPAVVPRNLDERLRRGVGLELPARAARVDVVVAPRVVQEAQLSAGVRAGGDVEIGSQRQRSGRDVEDRDRARASVGSRALGCPARVLSVALLLVLFGD